MVAETELSVTTFLRMSFAVFVSSYEVVMYCSQYNIYTIDVFIECNHYAQLLVIILI